MKLILKLTHRIWNRRISALLCRAYESSAMKPLLTLALLIGLAVSAGAQPYAQPYAQPVYPIYPTPAIPAGEWRPVYRPTWLGQALFGPIYVWVPYQQQGVPR